MAFAVTLAGACTGGDVQIDCRGMLTIAAAMMAAEQTIKIEQSRAYCY